MKKAKDLTTDQLHHIVDRIQYLAFCEMDGGSETSLPHVTWNRDKELGSEFISGVVNILTKYNLHPGKSGFGRKS